MQFQVDLKSGLPIYRQLMNQFRFYIASGAFPPGSKLPSIRSLAKQLAVNPATVVKTYNELAHAGMIELRQGKGAFVLTPEPQSDEDISALISPTIRQLVAEARSSGLTREALLDLVKKEFERFAAETEKGGQVTR